MSTARYDCFISWSEGDREGTHSNQRYGRICQILKKILIISVCSEFLSLFNIKPEINDQPNLNPKYTS